MNNINFKQTIDVKPPFSLDKQLTSYSILIQSLFVLIFIAIFLLILNPNGFNKAFGYEIFITGPILFILSILIKETFVFTNTPDKSWLSSFSQSKETWFLPTIILGIIIIGLAGLFSMLQVAGIFDANPPENNTAMITNFVVIAFFVFVVLFIYKNSKTRDDTILSTLPKSIQDLFAIRTKYTLAFIAFCLAVTILYFVNPWGIMTDYGGPVIFFTLFIGIILMIMITIYQYYIDNPLKPQTDTPTVMTFILKGVYILGSLGLSGILIYGALRIMGVFDQDASNPETWGSIIINLLLFCGMLGIIYKLANAGGYLDKNPWYRLIINSIFYIPCLLVTIITYIGEFIGIYKQSSTSTTSSFSPPTPFETKMLLLSLLLIGGYFTWVFLAKPYLTGKYLKQGGTQLVNQPIKTDKLTNIASYQTLNGEDKKAYKYAISFWVYLDAFSPSTSTSYMKILSYGENPTIKYDTKENTLYITVKQQTDESTTDESTTDEANPDEEFDFTSETVDKWKNQKSSTEDVKTMTFGNDLDKDGHRIIYKHPDVLLQKWNHIVLNYNGGTLDVFYNGKLVKSEIEVVPYITYDMLSIGSENGVYGNIANLLYFKNPLDVLTIHTLYSSLKNTNPPSISENNSQLISLTNN